MSLIGQAPIGALPVGATISPTLPTPPPAPMPPVVPGAVGYVLFDYGPFLRSDQYISNARRVQYLTRLTFDPPLSWLASTPFVTTSPTTGLARQAVQCAIYQNVAANYLTCVAVANDGTRLTAIGVQGNVLN